MLVSILYIMFQGDSYSKRRRRRNNVRDLLAQSNRNALGGGFEPVEHDCDTRIPQYKANFTIPDDAKFL